MSIFAMIGVSLLATVTSNAQSQQVPTLRIVSDDGNRSTGDTTTLTAMISPPAAGYSVFFQVSSGPDSGADFSCVTKCAGPVCSAQVTDDGTCRASYRNNGVAGTDTVRACMLFFAGTVTTYQTCARVAGLVAQNAVVLTFTQSVSVPTWTAWGSAITVAALSLVGAASMRRKRSLR